MPFAQTSRGCREPPVSVRCTFFDATACPALKPLTTNPHTHEPMGCTVWPSGEGTLFIVSEMLVGKLRSKDWFTSICRCTVLVHNERQIRQTGCQKTAHLTHSTPRRIECSTRSPRARTHRCAWVRRRGCGFLSVRGTRVLGTHAAVSHPGAAPMSRVRKIFFNWCI